MVNPVHRVHAQWTRAGRAVHHGPTVVPHRGHGGALTGAWPPAAPVRQSSPAGAQKGKRRTGSSARASTELGQCCSDRVTVVQNQEAAALGERAAQAWREGKRSEERCGETRRGCSPFIGGRGSAREGWPGLLTPALMALMPLKMGRLDERLRSAIKEANQGVG
jgi:hypothetical protein